VQTGKKKKKGIYHVKNSKPRPKGPGGGRGRDRYGIRSKKGIAPQAARQDDKGGPLLSCGTFIERRGKTPRGLAPHSPKKKKNTKTQKKKKGWAMRNRGGVGGRVREEE